MISEKNNRSSQRRCGEPSDIVLDSETWSDQETLVGEDNPGEGGSSSGEGDSPETQTESSADRWILNCVLRSSSSDRLDREKFTVTYIQLLNQPHRVTISCDYENAEPDSLEARLKQTQYQYEKGEEIYDSLRTSPRPGVDRAATMPTEIMWHTQHGPRPSEAAS